MALHRTNERHPADDRVLIIQDIEDFRLWRERSKLDISGLMWDLGYDQRAREAVLSEMYQAHATGHFKKTSKYAHIAKFDIPQTKENLGGCRTNIGHKTGDLTSSLLQAYDLATDVIHYLRASFRVNSYHPTEWHTHGDTMICGLQDRNTLCNSGRLEALGTEYEPDLFHAFLLGNDIPHIAPLKEKHHEKHPRMNMVVYSDLFL